MAGAGNVAIGNSDIGTMISAAPVDAEYLPFADSTGTQSQQSVGSFVSSSKVWEGTLAGQRNVIPIPVYILEIYRVPTICDQLVANWPATMQVTFSVPNTLMEQNSLSLFFPSRRHRDFQRQIEVLEFRPFPSHEFFGQLAHRGLCVVVQLPRGQMLLLPSWEKMPTRMLGYLFPEDLFYYYHFLLRSMKEIPESFSPNELQGEAYYFHWLRTGSNTEPNKRSRVTGPKLLKPGEERYVTTVTGQGQELLPGLPNEVTLYQIASKLPWRAFHLLSSVSRDWRQAIRSRQVYEARVHHRLTEQLVVCNHTFKISKKSKKLEVSQISLYSIKDGRFYDVPSLPHLGGIPKGCQTVSLDGKLYVLGGLKDKTSSLGSKEVYVLDLAGQTRGQRLWRRCQDMRVPRQDFGCGVMGEKIYVFGGTSVMEPVCGSEVYDPTIDSWSPLSSMLSLRFRHSVVSLGEELVVHGGCSFEPKYLDWRERRFIVDRNRFVIDLDGKVVCKVGDALKDYGGDDRIYIFQDGKVMDQDGESIGDFRDYHGDALSLEIYHPGKDEWRVVKPFQTDSDAKVFVAHRKYYSMSRHDIQVFDIERASWTHLHACSFPTIGPAYDIDPITVIALNDELLLAIVRWRRRWRTRGVAAVGSSLLRSRGFGSKLKEIVWEEANDVELSFGSTFKNETPFIVPIEL